MVHGDVGEVRALDGAEHHRLPDGLAEFIYQGSTFSLFVDRFETSGDDPRLVTSGSVNMQEVPGHPCPVPNAEAANDTTPDCRLISLLNTYGPGMRAAPKPVNPISDGAT